jgi:nitrogen regulatory protein P-II 1
MVSLASDTDLVPDEVLTSPSDRPGAIQEPLAQPEGGEMVNLVTAVIKPHKLEEVKDALKAIDMPGMTVDEVKGFGRQGGHTETYRGAEYKVDLLPKVKVEVLCSEADTDRVVDTIMNAARTDKIGDGKIWVTPVSKMVRIRTGERDGDAL